MGT
ncbi:hypothetical protein KGM_214737A, partial [Danaus plexippus plexippus]|jgi:hypothetical protein